LWESFDDPITGQKMMQLQQADGSWQWGAERDEPVVVVENGLENFQK
jgi:hypothetical protein